MDKQTENKIWNKVFKGEELTEQEKQLTGMDYEEWKQMHDKSRAGLIETYRWGSWPILFICGFFLLSSAVSNTKYLMHGAAAETSVIFMAAIGWILGLASVIVSFRMKKVSRQLQLERASQEQAVRMTETACTEVKQEE